MRKLASISPIPKALNRYSKISLENRKKNYSKIKNYNGDTKASLSFPGYRNNKEVVRELDSGRCAYCGLMIKITQTETVEHFRPKAELQFRDSYLRYDGLDVPLEKRKYKYKLSDVEDCKYGYFLWGDDARNLLPACECCNTGQGNNGLYICPPHNNSDPGKIESKIPYGKKILFPIGIDNKTDPRIGMEYIKSIRNEYPLLFNPYLDDPDILFRYKDPVTASNTNMSIVKIRPNSNLSKLEKLKAIVSINILGLNREMLCIARGDIHDNLSALEKEIDDCEQYNKPIEDWAFVSIRLAKEFNLQKNNLIGYRLREFGFLIHNLHSELLKHFPNKIPPSNNRNFENKVNEIFQFGSQNKPKPKLSAARRRFLATK